MLGYLKNFPKFYSKSITNEAILNLTNADMKIYRIIRICFWITSL